MIRRLLILLLIPTVLAHAELMEKIAIVVNNRAVTLYELKQIYRARSTEFYQKFSGEELQQKLAVLKETVITEKTEEQLLLEKAQLEGITISDEQMDNYLKNLMEENNIENMEQFENVLQQSIGMTVAEFRESQRTQNIARSVIQQQVISKISADEGEIRAYYESHLQDYQTEFTYDIQEIVIFFDENASIFAKTRAESCMEQLRSNAITFGEAVQQYSESGSKDYNGELQNIKKGDLNPTLENAALALNVNDVSDVIALPGSFHIIRLTGRTEPQPKPFAEVKESIERMLIDPQVDEAIRKFIDDLRQSFYVRVEVTPEDL